MTTYVPASKAASIRSMPTEALLTLIADCQRVQGACHPDTERWQRMSGYLHIAYAEMAAREVTA